MTYQGWANYETFATSLWINNDQGPHELARQLTKVAWKASESGGNEFVKDRARTLLCDILKGWVEETMIPDLRGTLAGDLLNAAFSEIDWHELADSFLLAEIKAYASSAE
jgi:hypothetical protein